MALSREDTLFGRIAVHNKIVSQAQFDECVREKESSGSRDDIGEIALAKGYINDKQLKAINKARDKHLEKKGSSSGGGGGAATATAAQPQRARAGVAVMDQPGGGGKLELKDEPGVNAPAQNDSGISIKRAPKPPRKQAAPVDEDTVPAQASDEAGFAGAAIRPRPFSQEHYKKMCALLKKSRDMGGSDLHMSCGAKPFLRIHGSLRAFDDWPTLTHEMNEKLIGSILSEEEWLTYEKHLDVDCCVAVPGSGRFRANACHQRRGFSAVFRVINEKIPTLKDLGLPEVLERLTTFHQGLVLVTGASGSGKSSTLAALIEIINTTRKENVITLEDPIEYVYAPKKCNIIQRQIDLHTRSWGNALRAALREDPDVIMVGEMRDLETVSLAITSAETGHLVLGTLHTTNATRTIDRILDVFPPREQSQIRAMVSESLKGVVSQQLVPRADGKGRVAAVEIMFHTPAVANLIREKQSFKLVSVLQTGKSRGMQLMDEALKQLLAAGTITKEDARKRAQNPKLFK